MTSRDPRHGVEFHVGRFSHPFFQEQLRAAPEGFSYIDRSGGDGTGPRQIALRGTRLARARKLAEPAAIRALSWAGYVRSSRLSPAPHCSLIHSAQLLLHSPDRPYVVDFECLEVFCLYQRAALRRPWARRRLLAALTDERCRFLLPWSEASRRGLETALGASAAARLLHKTVTVLPSIRPRTSRPAELGSGPLRVLFLGTAFEAKGGVESIRAISMVRKSHDVVLEVVSDVPVRWREQIENTAGVVVHPWPSPAALLDQLFAGADLLLFPSHMDTLGFVMLEAMAHGTPVLATRHFAVPELVEDGVSGIVLAGENPLYGEDGLSRFNYTLPPPAAFRRALADPSQPYVERIADALASLAERRDLLQRLAAGALARVTDGPLSIGRRKQALQPIYRAAMSA